jgi:hypothetical protein
MLQVIGTENNLLGRMLLSLAENLTPTVLSKSLLSNHQSIFHYAIDCTIESKQLKV